MIKVLVFCVVLGSILKPIEGNSKTQNTAIEEKPPVKDSKEPNDENSKVENINKIINATKETLGFVKSKDVIKDELRIKDAASFVTPKLPYSVVTMDAKSHNKTAALIRMVVHADEGSKNEKQSPKGQAIIGRIGLPAKPASADGNVLNVLRRLNTFVNNYQQRDLRKYERRYVITNYDVLESYINSRRINKNPSSNNNQELLHRKKNVNMDKADQSFEESGSGSDQTVKGDGAVKLNYDDRSDDYVISTKRNVWDYEHEQWADVKTVRWDDVHSSKETENVKEDDLKKTTKNHKVKENKITVAKDSNSKTIKFNSSENGKPIKKGSKYNRNLDSQRDDKTDTLKKRNSEEINDTSGGKSRITGKEEQANEEGKEGTEIKSEDNQHRARSNNSPNPNIGDGQKYSNKMDERDEPNIEKEAKYETQKSSIRREKLDDYDYNNKQREEKPEGSNKSGVHQSYKADNDLKYTKKHVDVTDYTENEHKKTREKESLYDDYKGSNDYRDEKKNKKAFDSKKTDRGDIGEKVTKKRSSDYKDYYGGREDKKALRNQDDSDKKSANDYKNYNNQNTDDGSQVTRKRSSDYKDYYGGQDEKKVSKNQDYSDKKFDNDYKNTDNKDSYGKSNKKREKGLDYTDKKLDDDYKNVNAKNDDYAMDNNKQDKKKKVKGGDYIDEAENKKSKSYNYDYPEKEPAKSSNKGSNKKNKGKLDYKDEDYKSNAAPYDKNANNDWDKVGVEKKHSNRDIKQNNDWGKVDKKDSYRDVTTRRTTKRKIDNYDYDKPVRKPKHKDYYEKESNIDKYDRTTKRFDIHGNNNWDSIGSTKRKPKKYVDYDDRPRKGRGSGGNAGGIRGFGHTPLPIRGRHSVYEDD